MHNFTVILRKIHRLSPDVKVDIAFDIVATDSEDARSQAQALADAEHGPAVFMPFVTVHLDEDDAENFEHEEVGSAKNIAYDTLAKSLEDAGIDPYSESDPIDLIGLADDLIEALIAAGVTIPHSIVDPHETDESRARKSERQAVVEELIRTF